MLVHHHHHHHHHAFLHLQLQCAGVELNLICDLQLCFLVLRFLFTGKVEWLQDACQRG
jgi:hypothetical protein